MCYSGLYALAQPHMLVKHLRRTNVINRKQVLAA